MFFCINSFFCVTISPVCDLILEQCLVIFQREAGHLKEVDASSLCSNTEEVTWLQQEEDSHPSGTERKEIRKLYDTQNSNRHNQQQVGMWKKVRHDYRLSKVPNFHSGFRKEDSCVPAALDARSAGQTVGVHFL